MCSFVTGFQTCALPICNLRLDPFCEHHREALRLSCAEDRDIWSVYPSNYVGADFDPNFDACLVPASTTSFAIFDEERLVGMTSYLGIDEANRADRKRTRLNSSH